MNPYVLTHFAEQDLNDIWDYLAIDNLDAADRVHQQLESAMRKLAKRSAIFGKI
jgi:plasmid stabilization system protein ParE